MAEQQTTNLRIVTPVEDDHEMPFGFDPASPNYDKHMKMLQRLRDSDDPEDVALYNKMMRME